MMKPKALGVRKNCALILVLFVATLKASAAEDGRVDFAREILPILSNKCFVCHGPDAKQDFLRLDSREAATRSFDGRHAIDPSDSSKSEILLRIHDAEDPMPPLDAEKQLSTAERGLLDAWVRQGGDYAKHWAFVPPKKASEAGGIDSFVAKQLEVKKADFAASADRATLARRAALVLTGLPPEPEQLERFLADESSDAYENYVDVLLASHRYGEHQARYWLDAVRYGDTHGLHLDNKRGIFPYRDWVVHALNSNLPLDDFITWQLAGDLLPNPSLEQLVATGFVRMNPSTSEGGAIPAEFQAKNNFDRTENLGTVLLGMTMICARCHTHKYDPIPQTEYYRLMAFFNSTAERSMDGNSYTYGPVIRAPGSQEAWKEVRSLESETDSLAAKARAILASGRGDVVAQAKARSAWKTSDWKSSPVVARDAAAPADFGDFKGLPGTTKQKLPGGDKAQWISFSIDLPESRSLEMEFSGGAGSRLAIDDAEQKVEQSGKSARSLVELSKGSHRVLIKMVGTGGGVIELKILDPWKKLAAAGKWSELSAEDRLGVLSDSKGPFSGHGLHDKARATRARWNAVRSTFTTTLVARELPSPRETRVLMRGEYNQPLGDALKPGIVEVMGAFPKGAPRNRLGLAHWLTSREHPLVSRVLINRVWQRVFGEGIVRTPEDFGLQGQQPTHPQLLDWLAVELQDSGWDLKHMLRLMVTSRTFRQDSARRKDLDDPENRLFARGPNHRLDAEVIRDMALWASELLDPDMGGEGVKPYQPPGLWSSLAHPGSNTKRYVQDKGQRLYRRSLYVYWKRTSPHPMMMLFDAPSREASCVKRSRTNTSLQSLGLFNETQRIEMSRKLAERLMRASQDDKERLDVLFQLVACRKPGDRERKACLDLLSAMRKGFSERKDDAVKLLSTGEAARDESLNPVDLAAWAQVAVTVLASDVAILLY